MIRVIIRESEIPTLKPCLGAMACFLFSAMPREGNLTPPSVENPGKWFFVGKNIRLPGSPCETLMLMDDADWCDVFEIVKVVLNINGELREGERHWNVSEECGLWMSAYYRGEAGPMIVWSNSEDCSTWYMSREAAIGEFGSENCVSPFWLIPITEDDYRSLAARKRKERAELMARVDAEFADREPEEPVSLEEELEWYKPV